MRFLVLLLFFLCLSFAVAPNSFAQVKFEKLVVQSFPPEIRANKQRWYLKHLTAMKETPIYNLPPESDKFVFRLLWLRSFHHPVCVKVEKSGESPAALLGKELSGAGGYAPGELIVNRKTEMSSESYDHLRDMLKSANFSEQPTDQDSDANDGAQWIFELNDKGKYHIVDAFGGGTVRDVGIYLLKEAKLLPDKHVY